MNPEVRENFAKRSKIIKAVRDYLESKGFIEVETPMMHQIPGGATARPFRTHHNALDIDLYLRIAPELYLKRLLVGGYERVYELNKNFRNEGISSRHNPEFSMLEFYIAYRDYNFLMDLSEELFAEVAMKAVGMKIPYGDDTFDLTPPWPRVPMLEALEKSGVPAEIFTDAEKAKQWARSKRKKPSRNIRQTTNSSLMGFVDRKLGNSSTDERTGAMDMNSIAGVIRAVVPAIPAYAVGKGWIPESVVADITAAAVAVAAAVWSVVTNRKPPAA